MPNFNITQRPTLFLITVAILLSASHASAQQQVRGFAVDRFYTSAPGGGWLVMDELNMHGSFGGAIALNLGYASNPLRITNGVQSLSVVSHQAIADFGFAFTYDRIRLYLNLATPFAIKGQSGNIANNSYTGPSVDWGSNPDVLLDARVGFDARIFGRPGSPFRLGASAQLFIPSGKPADYETDGTWRGMIRALFAGDVSFWTYAAHIGVHIRPLNEAKIDGAPRGSELLFGVATGPRLWVGRATAIIVGPEIYGETAFKSFFSSPATGLEALMSARIESLGDNRANFRIKLGAGGGLSPYFGAAQWRVVLAVELFGCKDVKH